MADILLVDDDYSVAFPLQELLQLEGHEVRFAENGQAGLNQVKQKIPDVILLDVEMPIMSGPDMALQLLLRDAGSELIPILLLSGSESLLEVAHELGTPYYLEKPYRIDQLISVLHQALTERMPPSFNMRGKELRSA